MVDNLLDLLSGGEYKRNASKQGEEDISKEAAQAASSKTKTEFDQLKTLTELGIDISFLSEYGKHSRRISVMMQVPPDSYNKEK
jgi:hypothetical protein